MCDIKEKSTILYCKKTTSLLAGFRGYADNFKFDRKEPGLRDACYPAGAGEPGRFEMHENSSWPGQSQVRLTVPTAYSIPAMHCLSLFLEQALIYSISDSSCS